MKAMIDPDKNPAVAFAPTYPSLSDLKKLFPKKLSEISVARSLSSLMLSVTAVMVSMAFGYYVILPETPPNFWESLILAAYAFWIGTCLVGFWILAHECGHGCFLKNKWLEDIIGLVLHTICLIPYFAWARSHLLHHANHGHIEKDTAYLPLLPESLRALLIYLLPRRYLGGVLTRIIYILAFTLLGWPLYLFFGATGGRFLGLNHFIPLKKKGFDPYPGWRLKAKIYLNTLIYGLWVYGIIQLLNSDWNLAVIWLYLIPIVFVNFWLVLYTYLHHTDEHSYWLDNSNWSFTEGAFSAIDRAYWKLTNLLHHNIGRYHVYHHLNSKIPHYHGPEATRILQKHYPQFYRMDPTNPLRALWRSIGKSGVVAKDSRGRYRFVSETGNLS